MWGYTLNPEALAERYVRVWREWSHRLTAIGFSDVAPYSSWPSLRVRTTKLELYGVPIALESLPPRSRSESSKPAAAYVKVVTERVANASEPSEIEPRCGHNKPRSKCPYCAAMGAKVRQ